MQPSNAFPLNCDAFDRLPLFVTDNAIAIAIVDIAAGKDVGQRKGKRKTALQSSAAQK